MATITSAQTGNFSSTSTWVGGVVPTSSDDAVAATGHVVAIDVDVTVISVQQAGTGKFTLGNGRTLTGNVIANAGTFTSGGTVEVTATTGNTATINGNVTGVSSTANNIAGVVVTGAGALVLNGNVTGSPGNASSLANSHAGVYTNANCSISITGALSSGTGTFKPAVRSGTGATSASITVTGSVTGGTGASNIGIYVEGNGTTVNVFGNITTGNSNSAYGVYATGNSVINVTGSVTSASTGSGGNSSAGILASGTSTQVFVTGNLFGGSGGTTGAVHLLGSSSSAVITGDVFGNTGLNYGVLAAGLSSTATVTGNVYAGNVSGGFAVGGTGASSLLNIVGSATAFGLPTTVQGAAVTSSATANGVIFQGDMTDSPQGAVAIYTRIFRMTATNSGVTRYANTVGYPNGTLVSRVSPDNVTGMAQVGDVRKNVVYGFSNQLTGTMAVPSAQSVAYGVPVDNTLGSAEFDLGRVATIIGLQVAAGKSV